MEVDYRCYQYNIAVPPFDEDHPINETLVPYWRLFWKSLLTEIKSKEGLNEDEIHWQNRITYLTNNKEIVGIQFIASYRPDELIQSEYAKRYLTSEAKKFLNSNKRKRINTLQYMSINPTYNQRKTGINFASVLSDLNYLQHNDMQADCTISVIRQSVGMHNMARKFGLKELCKTKKHSVDVSIMYTSSPERHPRKDIRNISDYLWANRKLISQKEFAA